MNVAPCKAIQCINPAQHDCGVHCCCLYSHQVRFIFIQTGVVGSFNLSDLLITLVTGLGSVKMHTGLPTSTCSRTL